MSQPPAKGPSGRPPQSTGSERLAIAGSGTIGCGLALCAAQQGAEVLLWGRSPASAERARDRVTALCERVERAELARQVRVTHELSELAGATLAVEAVVEEQPVKAELLRSLADVVGEQSVLATTTSALSVSELAAASGRPARLFGLHVFNPVERMELVEICFPTEAEADVRRRAWAFCEAIGKTAVEVPDETGFVVNRLLFPYLFDAVRLLERTGLEPEAIDACMKLGASHPMGPLELLDLVGIDVAEAIGDALHAESGDPAHRTPGRLKRLVAEGRLGRKSGAGFYEYG